MEGHVLKCKKFFSYFCAEGIGVTAIVDVHLEGEIAISPRNSRQSLTATELGWKFNRLENGE